MATTPGEATTERATRREGVVSPNIANASRLLNPGEATTDRMKRRVTAAAAGGATHIPRSSNTCAAEAQLSWTDYSCQIDRRFDHQAGPFSARNCVRQYRHGFITLLVLR